jgi:hypothetical protein
MGDPEARLMYLFRTPLRHSTLKTDLDTINEEFLEASLSGPSWCY